MRHLKFLMERGLMMMQIDITNGVFNFFMIMICSTYGALRLGWDLGNMIRKKFKGADEND